MQFMDAHGHPGKKRWCVLLTPPQKQSEGGRLGLVVLSPGAPANDSHLKVIATPENGLDLSKQWCARADEPMGFHPSSNSPVLGRKAPVSTEELTRIDAAVKEFLGL